MKKPDASSEDFSGWDDIPPDPSDSAGIDAPVIQSSEWREVRVINEHMSDIQIPNQRRKRPIIRGRIIA